MSAQPEPDVRSPGVLGERRYRLTVYYDLYVILDIFSRYAPGWLVASTETGELAKQFIDNTIATAGVVPHVVHADRGTSMTSKPVALPLADLGIVHSHSRPRVSTDNPYSEAQFKTLKYCPTFPDRFASVEHARSFCTTFFTNYNHDHAIPLWPTHARVRPLRTVVEAREQRPETRRGIRP